MKRRSPQENLHPSLFAEANTGKETASPRTSSSSATVPLATRMRPLTLDEYVGQAHLLGEKGVLRQAITVDRIPSMILWGPPGSGKTSLAAIIGRTAKAKISGISAVSAGVADLRKVVEEAQARLELTGQRTILFIDEIHRFSKSQQDAILPFVEDGTVTLIGATTENPSFEVNAPLLSRARVYKLEPLTDGEIMTLLTRSLEDTTRGLGKQQAAAQPEALAYLVRMANGDARVALDTLELAVTLAKADDGGQLTITEGDIASALQRRVLPHDKKGDFHYDLISAYIKSVRGSDPHAAVYWLARMLEGGEEPLFVARRIVILASEDIGLADPNALSVAVAAQQAVHFIGMPEGIYPLTQATLYLATAPKSNSALRAYAAAREAVQETGNLSVPLHLRNAPTGLMAAFGQGKDYRYPHSYDENWVAEVYLPTPLEGQHYYEPGTVGFEQELCDRMREHQARTAQAMPDAEESEQTPEG
ncbi:MAG: replication-associated recombination protein A [Chloroflexi bacterium]|nr:replication-associated recombination protein A [Chloroflexota bacterium]